MPNNDRMVPPYLLQTSLSDEVSARARDISPRGVARNATSGLAITMSWPFAIIISSRERVFQIACGNGVLPSLSVAWLLEIFGIFGVLSVLCLLSELGAECFRVDLTLPVVVTERACCKIGPQVGADEMH